jgi:hypothetical protein
VPFAARYLGVMVRPSTEETLANGADKAPLILMFS